MTSLKKLEHDRTVAELASVEALLASLTDEDVMTRLSLEDRRDELQRTVAEMAGKRRLQFLEHATFAVSSRLRERFVVAAAEERASVATELRRMGVDHIVLSTAGDWLRSLAAELHVRGLRS